MLGLVSNSPLSFFFHCPVFFFFQEVYTFTVGYHELTGSKVPLKSPILVLKKIKHPDVDRSRESNCNVELQVIGIISHRILFKTRPKALISSKILFWIFNAHITLGNILKQLANKFIFYTVLTGQAGPLPLIKGEFLDTKLLISQEGSESLDTPSLSIAMGVSFIQ